MYLSLVGVLHEDLISIKPGSHEGHNHKQRKQRMNSPLRLAKTKQQ